MRTNIPIVMRKICIVIPLLLGQLIRIEVFCVVLSISVLLKNLLAGNLGIGPYQNGLVSCCIFKNLSFNFVLERWNWT